MSTTIRKVKQISDTEDIVLLCNDRAKVKGHGLSKEELRYIESERKKAKRLIAVNQYTRWVFVQIIEKKNPPYKTFEQCRRDGNILAAVMNRCKARKITVIDVNQEQEPTLAYAEGIALGNYQFLKYYSDAKARKTTLSAIGIHSSVIQSRQVADLSNVVAGNCLARDLVNEPQSYLTARQLSQEIRKASKASGFKFEVFNKAKIEALKMGGLLAVNKGSSEPPTFNILEWKPKNAVNKQPIVFVGKGIVFDTGGLSLKPTPNSMDHMKSDMAGAAAVIGAVTAAARSKLPVYVIGLIPATDNRPAGNAYAPGDVITMYNGSKVEVLNTDAEGRLVLADALSYAQKLNPELVIDLATLTGAAIKAIGTYGIVSMGTADKTVHNKLKTCGETVYERLAEMPFWEEYETDIESDIADLKNIGSANAGAITAGKFLDHFTRKDSKTAYQWLHLDIAGPSYLDKQESYRPKGGTGVGVRLLFEYLKNRAN